MGNPLQESTNKVTPCGFLYIHPLQNAQLLVTLLQNEEALVRHCP